MAVQFCGHRSAKAALCTHEYLDASALFIAEYQAEVADDVLVGTKSELVVEVNDRVPMTTTCMRSIFRLFF